jgi:hypothetical protein
MAVTFQHCYKRARSTNAAVRLDSIFALSTKPVKEYSQTYACPKIYDAISNSQEKYGRQLIVNFPRMSSHWKSRYTISEVRKFSILK